MIKLFVYLIKPASREGRPDYTAADRNLMPLDCRSCFCRLQADCGKAPCVLGRALKSKGIPNSTMADRSLWKSGNFFVRYLVIWLLRASTDQAAHRILTLFPMENCGYMGCPKSFPYFGFFACLTFIYVLQQYHKLAALLLSCRTNSPSRI